MWGNPKLFHRAKSIEKKYWDKKNIDNWEKLLIDPPRTNNARYCESLTLKKVISTIKHEM